MVVNYIGAKPALPVVCDSSVVVYVLGEAVSKAFSLNRG